MSDSNSDGGLKKKRSKLAQVVQNFFTKVSQVIIQARSVPEPKASFFEAPENSTSSKINKWFNLHMASIDSDWIRQELRPWKSSSDLTQIPPMIIETYLDLRQLSPCEMVMLEDDHGHSWPVAEAGSKKQEVVLERWLIELDRSTTQFDAIEELPLVYKQAIVSIRVIYGIVRLLPAYKAKKLVGKSSNKNLSLRNRIIDGKQVSSKGRIGLSKSILPHQVLLTDSHMTQREFTPIHTSSGTLRVSVAYRNHFKFNAQDQEERLSNHFIISDKADAEDARRLSVGSESSALENVEHTGTEINPEIDEHNDHTARFPSPSDQIEGKRGRGSFDQFREKFSVSPCTSELNERGSMKQFSKNKPTSMAVSSSHSSAKRPSIQPFKVGSIGGSSPPPQAIPTSTNSSSIERRISITSNRSGSNASLVALLRNARGSMSSTNTPNTIAISNPQNQSLPRSISSSHGSQLHNEDNYHDYTSSTPRFSSSFGSRQSRRMSNTSSRFAVGSNQENNPSYFSTSVESDSSRAPLSGLYADDDISSFVQMIDGTSDLRLSNSNQDSKSDTPNNENSSHQDALERFQLLKSQYQHLSDSVNASLIIQHNQTGSRHGSHSDLKVTTRKSSRSTTSPAPSLPLGSYEQSHLPSISSQLSKAEDKLGDTGSDTSGGYHGDIMRAPGSKLVASASTATTMAHASHNPQPKTREFTSGLATTPSVYNTVNQGVKYTDVFEEDDEGADYFSGSRKSKPSDSTGQDMSFDNDDLLFEMTDTR